MDHDDALEVAERVRAGCIDAARAAYEDAAIRGLCGEGALEAAIGALQSLDIEPLVAGAAGSKEAGESAD